MRNEEQGQGFRELPAAQPAGGPGADDPHAAEEQPPA